MTSPTAQTRAHEVSKQFGQSLWYDNVKRSELQDGTFAKLIASGVRGCTSNPSIFHKAIVGSSDYDASLKSLAEAGNSSDEIYYCLVSDDIRSAADQLKPVYDASEGEDGFISVEVLPKHQDDHEATVAEAVALRGRIGRDNVMIKVPATEAGLVALTELTARGVSVNVTLIFSVKQYEQVANAYLAGLEKALQNGVDLSKIASVASVFVSRVDARVDPALTAAGKPELAGTAALANAKRAYQQYLGLFASERFAPLKAAGARPQRLLWASTGTKNPDFKDTLYVDALIGPQTVNTLPPATLAAFLDHGTASETLTANLPQASAHLEAIGQAGIDLQSVCDELMAEGLAAFSTSMDELMSDLERRRVEYSSES